MLLIRWRKTPDCLLIRSRAAGRIDYTNTIMADLFKPIPPNESLIEYPSDFPIKIMGLTHDDFTPTIVELVTSFDPEFHEGKLELRPSSAGKYLAITVTVRATSREQLDELYRALSGHPMVKFVL
jgi:putative lipoic acid-binding regulatory protein